MPTPSEYALEDALETITQRDCGDVRLRDYEAVELDEYIQSLHAKLANLDTAINEARLEGARAMQNAAALDLANNHPQRMSDGTIEWHQSHERLTNNGAYAKALQVERIRALDPQQVINESMGK